MVRLLFGLLSEVENRTPNALLAGFGMEPEAVAARLAARLMRGLRQPAFRETLITILAGIFADRLDRWPPGSPADYLPAGLQTTLVDFLHRRLSLLLADELPRLSERFAVEEVVEERINALPVERVEELLLGIMREHFTYINLFGALIGALIGILQVMLFR